MAIPFFSLSADADVSQILLWFDEFGVEELDWSAQSPDFNRSEHLQAELEKFRTSGPAPEDRNRSEHLVLHQKTGTVQDSGPKSLLIKPEEFKLL